MPHPEPDDQLDEILTALAGLRGGRRGPFEGDQGERSRDAGRAGWSGGGGPHDHPHPPHGHGGPQGRGGPWAHGGPRLGGPARLRLLEALAAASNPLTVSEAAGAVGVDQPRASRLVQQSVELGLVRREADPDDARRTRIVLTDEGTRLVSGFRGRRREQLEQGLARVAPAERPERARLLAKLAASWPR